MENGRVPGANIGTSRSMPLFEGSSSWSTSQMASQSIHHKMKETPVSKLFFSDVNVEALQQGIRYRVYVESGSRHVIDRQSEVELGIVMRSVYLQDGANVDTDVIKQVRGLNILVIEYCVPTILREINMFKKFRDDISSLPPPMPRGGIATVKGERSLVLPQPGVAS